MKKPGFIVAETFLSLVLVASLAAVAALAIDIKTDGKLIPPELYGGKSQSSQASQQSSVESKDESSQSEQQSSSEEKQESKQESSKQENSKVKADTSLKITDDTAFGQGDENDDIKKIQKRLKELGYGKFEDGITNYFGEMTAKAFKQFQKNNGLDDDGYAGADALRLLFSDKVKPASASSQSSQQETTEQQ